MPILMGKFAEAEADGPGDAPFSRHAPSGCSSSSAPRCASAATC